MQTAYYFPFWYAPKSDLDLGATFKTFRLDSHIQTSLKLP